ncbi:MAG: hypothetical protein KBG42_08780 [Lachnospiraceae bacterium]|nr:hypothetical protein [Lachnospiraceae bacterium]
MSKLTPGAKRLLIIIPIAIALIIFICIALYRNRKIDSLDGFWETRGREHYVAYVHGDTIDIFRFEDSAETYIANWNPGHRISGHFTPPAPGFNHYEWDLTYDYNRTNANFVDNGIAWHASEDLSFQTDPMNIRFEYKDGKIIRYYDLGETDVFYPSGTDHLQAEMQAGIYDMQHEISQLAIPLELGTITELPLADGSEGNLLFVEVTNPNIFRINDPAMLFYNATGDTVMGECTFGCYIDAAYHAVLVTVNNTRCDLDAPHSDLLYSEYGITIPDLGAGTPVKAADSEVRPGTVDVNVHSDAYTEPEVFKIAVVFYKEGEIVGGGYDYFTLDAPDMTIPVPILTELPDYDDYDIFIY